LRPGANSRASFSTSARFLTESRVSIVVKIVQRHSTIQ
jgi:hypothetical protein